MEDKMLLEENDQTVADLTFVQIREVSDRRKPLSTVSRKYREDALGSISLRILENSVAKWVPYGEKNFPGARDVPLRVRRRYLRPAKCKAPRESADSELWFIPLRESCAAQ